MENKFYTINDLIELLQLSRLSIYRFIKNGDLQTYKIGKNHRVKEDDLNKFLLKNKNKK